MSGQQYRFAGHELGPRIMVDPASMVFRARRIRPASARPRDAPEEPPRDVLLRVSEPIDDVDNDLRVAEFRRRVRVAGAIEHPAFTPIVSGGHADERVYVAAEWPAGVTLEEHLDRVGRIDPVTACRMLTPVAEALDTLHAARVVHGAVSPRTIWVDVAQQPPSVQLSGLGLDMLLFVADDDEEAPVHDGLYAAPEQLAGRRSSPATDQYALACTIYHCVAGRPPFRSPMAAAHLGTHMLPRLPRTGDNADVSRRLYDALTTALRAQASDRYPSCDALVRAALEAASGQPVPPRLPLPARRQLPAASQPVIPVDERRLERRPEPPPVPPRRSGVRFGLTAAALVLVIIAAVTVFFMLAFSDIGAVIAPDAAGLPAIT